jgi:hypothetical protein
MVRVEVDPLGSQTPAGDGMRQPPADLIYTGGQRPPQEANFRIYCSARYP